MLKKLESPSVQYTSGPGGLGPALGGALLGAAVFSAVVGGAPSLLDSTLAARVRSGWVVNLCSTMAFFAALLLLLARARWQSRQRCAFLLPILDQGDDALLLPDDALQCRRDLRQLKAGEQDTILVRLLGAALARSRCHWSPQDAAAAIQDQAELAQCEIDTRYALIRYLTWAIPPIGFIGTVLGIGSAMGAMSPTANDQGGQLMQLAAGHLHTAFDTTLVALVLSIMVMFFMFRIQSRDEAIGAARQADWCLRRFVYRMHVVNH